MADLSATAGELQRRLVAGDATSEDLVKAFLAQIDKHNSNGAKLNAVISTCPDHIARDTAVRLDRERQQGRVRSLLHGIPIILKDAIVTSPELGMRTTAGSALFAGMRAVGNAPAAQKLVDAGMIVLAKGNMTEFCGLKSDDTPIGWSACGGQTRSPYHRADLREEDQPVPGGSSSGPAVGVAAGFAPVGIGTETAGSNVYPASVNGLYALTLTRGAVSTQGVFKLSGSFDSLGIQARSPADVAAVAEVLLGRGDLRTTPEDAWETLSVGVLECTWGTQGVHEGVGVGKWAQPDMRAIYGEAVETMRAQAARLVYPIELPDASTLGHDGETLTSIAYYEFPALVEDFIANFESEDGINTLRDVISWNEKHAEQALPEPHTTQTELYASLASKLTPERHSAALKALHALANGSLESVMEAHGLDVIVSASESTLVAYAALAGWPVATVPLGNLKTNAQPFGFFVLARAGRDDILIRFMTAYYGAFGSVKPPSHLFE